MGKQDTGMIDVGAKEVTRREAKARGFISLQADTLTRVRAGEVPKGDVLEVARIAGIMAAKRTASILPLCHPLTLDYVGVSLNVSDSGIEIISTVRAQGRTGVEMEALTAVAAAALTVYDMCKQLDRAAVIREICLLEKSGGKSGRFLRGER